LRIKLANTGGAGDIDFSNVVSNHIKSNKHKAFIF